MSQWWVFCDDQDKKKNHCDVSEFKNDTMVYCDVSSIGLCYPLSVFPDGVLSCETDKDAEWQVFAIAVTEDEFAEVEGLVCGLGAECLLNDGFSENCRISV